MSEEKKPNIYQRINKVREVVEYAKKDKAVEGYKAVTHDQITALVRAHFVEHGIVVVPQEIQSATVPTGTTTSKGTPFIRFEAKYSIDFVNMDDPADKISVVLTSHALDHGDKAPGKGISYAVKAAILKLLSIETGEDDESRYDQEPEKKKSVVEAGMLADYLAAIEAANTQGELLAAYIPALEVASSVGDKAAAEKLSAAKGKKLAEIKAAKK